MSRYVSEEDWFLLLALCHVPKSKPCALEQTRRCRVPHPPPSSGRTTLNADWAPHGSLSMAISQSLAPPNRLLLHSSSPRRRKSLPTRSSSTTSRTKRSTLPNFSPRSLQLLQAEACAGRPTGLPLRASCPVCRRTLHPTTEQAPRRLLPSPTRVQQRRQRQRRTAPREDRSRLLRVQAGLAVHLERRTRSH